MFTWLMLGNFPNYKKNSQDLNNLQVVEMQIYYPYPILYY